MKLKKLLLVGGIVGLAVAFIGTGTIKKYASYARQEIQQFADKAGTPEREIERLREEVKKLDKVEKEMKDELAQQIVSCDRLVMATAELRAKVTNEKAEALAFADQIDNAKGKVSFGSRTISPDEAKRQLKSMVSAYQHREKTVSSMETTLIHKEEAKKMLAAQVSEIQTERLRLTNELDAIEAEYQALKLAGMKNKYHRDDSKWSNVREGIEKLREKMEVQRVRVGLDTGAGRIDAPITESASDIVAPLKKGDGTE
jgi:chromosome segregation ATPase